MQKLLKEIQDVIYLITKTLLTCVKGPYRPKEVIHHLSNMGIGSLAIIVISTGFAGLVVTGEIAFHMDMALHSIEMIPGVSGQFIFRELGIIIPSLLLVAKVGAATTAEVGSMKITEQIDALKLLKIDPIEYLVYPRFVASIISTTCLTFISVFITLVSAIGLAVLQHDISVSEYLNHLIPFLKFLDIVCALVKGMAFGAVMPLVSCSYGFHCKGGAEGVGLATTNSVVLSTVIIIILDFIITYFFSLFM